MDQVDLGMGIPLLIQDHSETIVYMDKFSDEQDLIEEDDSGLFEKAEDSFGGETLVIDGTNEDSMKGVGSIAGDLLSGETFVVNGVGDDGEYESVDEKSAEDLDVSKENLSEYLLDNNNLKSTTTEPEVYLSGQMIELADGRTAFVENPKGAAEGEGKNEVCTPIKLYNGSVIYVVTETLLSDNLNGAIGCVEEEKMTAEESVPVAEEERTDKNKGFQCSYKNCNKSYTSFHRLKVHLRVHTGDRPFRCSVEGCNKAFSTGFGLKTHFRTHNGERPYTCNHENCEKGFKTSGDLQKHIRTHTGERPFLCPIPNCGRSFTTCNICKVHVRTHTGERPYKCTYSNCDKTFASVTNWRNHLRIHSGEKPYVCSVEKCGRRFTEYSSLYKHNMVHRQQPHLCLICGKTYRQASGLMIHTKTVHGDQETFLMVDEKAPMRVAGTVVTSSSAATSGEEEDTTQESEQTAVLFVNNIKLEDGVLEDSLFTELREVSSLDV